jgi:amidohydrolase
VPTAQSLGGEDFAWYLDSVPGSMARLGVKPPGLERPVDLHQGMFDVDEACLPVAVRVLVTAAVAALTAA